MSSPTHNNCPQPSSIWTRSTIYDRHERRRAKTMESCNDNDDRPAMVRVLAQLRPEPFEAVPLPRSFAAATATTTVPVLDADTTTVFTSHPSSCSKPGGTTTKASSCGFWSTAISAALGARLADAGMTLVRSVPLSRPRTAAYSATSTTTTPLWETQQGLSSLSVRMTSAPAAPTPAPLLSNRTTTTTTTSRGLFLRAPPPSFLPRCFSPSVVPLVILFGTQAAVASPKDDSSSMAHSIVASSVAGAALGLFQTRTTTTGGPTLLLHESGAAVVYFGSYNILRRHCCRGGGASAGEEDLVSTAVAGVVAGTLYEAIRGQALFASSSASPFGRPALSLVRAAPAHALFFVGYETAKTFLAGLGR